MKTPQIPTSKFEKARLALASGDTEKIAAAIGNLVDSNHDLDLDLAVKHVVQSLDRSAS